MAELPVVRRWGPRCLPAHQHISRKSLCDKCRWSCSQGGLLLTWPPTDGVSQRDSSASPGVMCSPELMVGTSPLGNVFPLLLLPYGFLPLCECTTTTCLCLFFEAVMWLLTSWGFCKELPRWARWDKAAQHKGASQ